MEVLTEMDEYFNAMSKINMDEPVMPYVKGRLVESDTYNKVQKILNTPELEKAHMYCYDLDLENLEECDIMKINNLYKLGVDRGFIDDDFQYQDCKVDDCCKIEEPKVEEPVVQTNPRAKIPCFVAMYSAMKDGQIKTGEAYSRAISVQAAKSDVIAQLSRFGYTNISILAIEATEEDACSCSLSEGAVGAAVGSLGGAVAGNAVGGPVGAAIGTAAGAALGSKLGEDDYLKGRVHNGHLNEGDTHEYELEFDFDDGIGSGNKTDKIEALSLEDAISKLEANGYGSITKVYYASEDGKEISLDDDYLKGRVHNIHIPEAEEDAESPSDDSNEGDSSDDSASDDSGEDDSSDDSDDSASDDSGEDDSSEDDSSDDLDDDSSDDNSSDDDSGEDDADDTSNDDDSADDDSADDSEEDADDSEEDAEEDADEEAASSDDSDDDELDDNKKADLKDNYKKTFKNTMLKCKFEEKSFDDLTLKEKVKFFTELSKTWKEDYEPSAFMSDKEIDQLNKIVVKK